MNKVLLLLIFSVSISFAFANSNLPPCPKSLNKTWDNCWGSVSKDGERYVGEWKNNKWDGHGIMYFKNSVSVEKYVGEFKNNKIHGYGTEYHRNGHSISGEFRNNNPIGLLICTFPDNKKYLCEYINKEFKIYEQTDMVLEDIR